MFGQFTTWVSNLGWSTALTWNHGRLVADLRGNLVGDNGERELARAVGARFSDCCLGTDAEYSPSRVVSSDSPKLHWLKMVHHQFPQWMWGFPHPYPSTIRGQISEELPKLERLELRLGGNCRSSGAGPLHHELKNAVWSSKLGEMMGKCTHC